jgi:hypothetical protein
MQWKSTKYFVATFVFIVSIVPASLQASAGETITIRRSGSGLVFDGIGAISGGGGNSRLLIDYSEPYRSRILDCLFKPHYGANLQILKVEIGGDMDSTDGSEPSHMHTRHDGNYNRGYEWWLMEQAMARNPGITLVALPWGAPGWIGNGNYWSQNMIDYIVKWLKHAKADHHLTINYVGGRNENGWNDTWYRNLRAVLNANGLSRVKIVGSDDWAPKLVWGIAADMKKDPSLYRAIDVVGDHGPGWGVYPTPTAESLGKPLWDSESHFDNKVAPYNEVARIINRNYLRGRLVATIFWPMISAIYDNLPFENVGLIKCNQPWSGYYRLTPALWVMAQTTQFTKPGWRYIDSASGFIGGDSTGNHGSFTTLRSPDGRDFSTIIETVDAQQKQTIHLRVLGFRKRTLHVWTTDPASPDPSRWFVKLADLPPVQGLYSLTLDAGHIYTITTTTGQSKGDAPPPPAAPFPIPYADNFDEYAAGNWESPKYFSDIYGVFETARCAGGREGICLRQEVPEKPIAWKPDANRPFTEIGNLSWTNYRVSSDVLLQQPGSVDLIGRLSGMDYHDTPNSYVLRVSNTGNWSLLRTAAKKEQSILAAGRVSVLGINRWHNLTLNFQGEAITAEIDHITVTTLSDSSLARGMAGLGVVGYIHAEFDNFKVEPLESRHAP